MDLNSRVQKIINYSELSSSEFADEIGVQRSNISHVLYGRNKPSLDFLMKIKDRFPEIQWEWLIEGKGSMVFSEDETEDCFKILGRLNNERVYRYIPQKYIAPHENLLKYKVLVPAANGSGAIGEVLSTPLVGTPLVGFTDTFISFGAFDTESEAKAMLKYIKTKFARAMLGILKITQDNTKDKWKYVPLQDFTLNSDIDWTQSVADIDRQLYQKYDLSPEEIAFIETHVREMD